MRLVISIVLAFAVGCTAKTDQKGPPPPREVDIYAVSASEVRESADYLGSIISRQTVNILPQVAGYVRKILIKPGQKVEPGDPLLEIDQRQEAAALDRAAANENSAQTALELAKQTLVRTQGMYREGIVSAQELERAQAAVDTAAALSKAAAAQVAQRQVQLQYYAVKAPFAGTAGDVRVRIGDYVTPLTMLTSIAQSDALEISIAVPADRARNVHVETPIELLDTDGKVLITTSVYFIAPEADSRTQLVDVRAAFRNTAGLRPSELIPARLIYGVRTALQVPALAVIRQSGQPFVFAVVEKDGKTIVSRKPVTLGPLGDKSYVVEKGLEPGEKIAVSSLQMLRDGMPVKPKAASPTTATTASEN